MHRKNLQAKLQAFAEITPKTLHFDGLQRTHSTNYNKLYQLLVSVQDIFQQPLLGLPFGVRCTTELMLAAQLNRQNCWGFFADACNPAFRKPTSFHGDLLLNGAQHPRFVSTWKWPHQRRIDSSTMPSYARQRFSNCSPDTPSPLRSLRIKRVGYR